MSSEAMGELVPVGGGDAIPLIRNQLTMGRRESCDIPLRFPNVSGIHCRLVYEHGYWFIEDLNSTNGVKVNGLRVLKKVLLPGDKLTIAKRTYTIEYALVAGRRALEEILEGEEEDIMSTPLLDRAGLNHPPRGGKRSSRSKKPAINVDLSEDEDE